MERSLLFTNTTPSTAIVKITDYKYVRLDRTENGVAELVLCRPKEYNSMDDDFYNEFLSIFDEIQNDDKIKCVILWGEGRGLTAGLNLSKSLSSIMGDDEQSQAKQNVELFKMIRRWQGSLDKIYKCSKPVIAAIHGACIGGGVDMITACDIRLCSSDAKFSIRETKLAIIADLGTLQRIQKIVGNGFAREMALTGKDIDAATAAKFGLVNNVYKDKDTLLIEARKMAQEIAKNSSLVVQLTKLTLNHANDHSIDEGLYRVALQNAAFLKTEDLNEAGASFFEKRAPQFKSNL
ncbi:hypothetical protein DICPUDRAFT_155167 [Dictyostelium purpureum]|uniref:Enoyl-CoA hydratase n=1 Tax=Dictyostelium purpureum TaxID=5786 RepID=F0ZT90_DICPU|nr:uncharacterized protein DICPUDRAFT_155167 [Dictyostelium purpureum]EGC32852.1 hypothetical protein DICPUDRAFT_155167 [Dictyostelium purpureum]|eukprot:XP_003290637.1 hypothetical protein DICPUDRAFT_155167 [Dictyostelium purpureum]